MKVGNKIKTKLRSDKEKRIGKKLRKKAVRWYADQVTGTSDLLKESL